MKQDDILELMKAIVHNKVLLMVVLSKLGMKDEEIDELNKTIYETLDKKIEDYAKGDFDEEEIAD